MLNDLYDNAGGHLKGWAKGIFITETICAVIAGIYFYRQESIGLALLVIVLGPISGWVYSLPLYALGQIAEDVQRMKLPILEPEKKQTKNKFESALKKEATNATRSKERRCPNCGEVVRSNKCEMCGKVIDL